MVYLPNKYLENFGRARFSQPDLLSVNEHEWTIRAMTQPEHRTESFVVRVWLERREIVDALPVWRGVIEHVASGKRQYILDLESVELFMEEYMHGWGVKTQAQLVPREKFSWSSALHLLMRNFERA